MTIGIYSSEYLIRHSIIDFFRNENENAEKISDYMDMYLSKYDLIIVDLDSIGIEDFIAISNKSFSKFIVLASQLNLSDIEKLKKAKVTNIIMKPFNYKTFKEKVNKVLKK